MEDRIYKSHEKKLDFITISDYFIGYPKKLKFKGYRFYYPIHSMRIIEIGSAKFIENDKISGSDKPRNMVIQ